MNSINGKRIFDICKKLININRSLTGEGNRKTLKILSRINKNLKIKKFKSGEKIFDWKIPLEWNIKNAWIKNSKNKKIIDFKNNNLHVVGYSQPVKKTLSLNLLKKKLFTYKKLPNAIPYVTSYYKKFWGFCMSYNDYKKLKPGNYRVTIKSTLKKGDLCYSDTLLKGKSKKQILFSSYLCHPQMANHELSGPLAMIVIYDYLKKQKNLKFSYRFLICPENIGSAAFLHKNKRNIKKLIKGGYILNFLANGSKVTYKKSRLSNSLSDKAAENVLINLKRKIKINNYIPEGADERQFCSPGFNLPIGVLSRNDYNDFKEYHTSLDNLSKFNLKTFYESIEIIIKLIETLEINFVPQSTIIYGTHQFSRRKSSLYDQVFYKRQKEDITKVLLEILNMAEGNMDLLTIANKKGFSLSSNKGLIEKMLKEKLIKKV